MADISVKFGTSAPIKFREYDKNHPEVDLELEVRAAGTTIVSAYDSGLYFNDEEIASKTRKIVLESLEERIKSWPEGVSFWKKATKAVLENYIDEQLSENGITARTVLFSFVLTPESRELYDAVVKHVTEQRWTIDIADWYRKVIEGNEGQPVIGTYNYVRPPMGKNPFTPSSNDEGFSTGKNTVLGIVPNGSPINTSGSKYCTNCGAKREGNAKFCTECGAKFD